MDKRKPNRKTILNKFIYVIDMENKKYLKIFIVLFYLNNYHYHSH